MSCGSLKKDITDEELHTDAKIYSGLNKNPVPDLDLTLVGRPLGGDASCKFCLDFIQDKAV